MGLYRRRGRGSSAQFRRSVSWWTSIGAFATLLVGVALTPTYEALQEHLFRDGAFDNIVEPRNLNNLIKDDPLIDSPVETANNKGWVIIHIAIIAYMLLGLNTVCDAYFTGALDEMVIQWKVKPDVAGATFMAAGGSAPELFTSLIGTNVSENDIGFGTIVGSAVFNVLFVIGLCGFAAKEAIDLTWWPLFRDCTYYIFSLTLLAIFSSSGQEIELWEAIVLFLTYVGYCIIMYFNPTFERMLLPADPGVNTAKLDQVAPVPDTGSTGQQPAHDEPHHIRVAQPKFTRSQSQHGHNDGSGGEAKTSTNEGDCGNPDGEGHCTEEEEEEDDIEALMIKPDSTFAQVMWYLSLPIYVPLYFLTPKPSERGFLGTFVVSLAFIAGFSFFLVYCVEILGQVLGIHEIIMGFTLLAAGTSIPDAVSSVAVARAGEGDMAVSSSIGSNIFDILVGLPIPWMIKILLVENVGKGVKDFRVPILSDYIVMYVIILMMMVFCVVLSIHCLGWVLNRVLGVGMAMLYAVFLLIVLIVEFTRPEELKFGR